METAAAAFRERVVGVKRGLFRSFWLNFNLELCSSEASIDYELFGIYLSRRMAGRLAILSSRSVLSSSTTISPSCILFNKLRFSRIR